MDTATASTAVTDGDLAGQVEAITGPLGVTARLHAREVAGDAALGWRADDAVVMASVFKIPILLELCRQASDGRLDPQQRIRVEPDQRTPGPTGISTLLDPVELSLRDLAQLMITVSDNTATDVVLDLVGLDAVNTTLRDLGLESTHLVGDCRVVLDAMAHAMGASSSDAIGSFLAGLSPEDQAAALARARTSESADPQRTTRSTPTETTRLLQLVWQDAAGPAEACAEVRRVLGLQVWPHRLRAGFGDDIAVAGKTGTLPPWRNEAGVVTYPDGASYAVAVYLEVDADQLVDPDADRAIGRLARLAVDHLRGSG